MDREIALCELKGRIKNDSLIKHSLAVEAIMINFANYYKEEKEKWGLAGLLHDIDHEKTEGDPSKHGLIGADILERIGVDSSIVYAVKAHNDYHGIERKRKLDKVLYSADPLSSLITAAALALPSKKLADVTVEFVMKKMEEKSFARGSDREQIKACASLNLALEEFIEISLEAMKNISTDLGL